MCSHVKKMKGVESSALLDMIDPNIKLDLDGILTGKVIY